MEQFRSRYEVLKVDDDKLGMKEKQSWSFQDNNSTIANFANATAAAAAAAAEGYDTVIEVKNIEIQETVTSEAKQKLQGETPEKKEVYDSDSKSLHSSSSASGSPKHKQNGKQVQIPQEESTSQEEFPRETKINLVEEIEGELSDFDVEKILGTHNLCCPNCHSSTVVTVILRKKEKTDVPPPPPPTPPETPLLCRCLECFTVFFTGVGEFFGRLLTCGSEHVSVQQGVGSSSGQSQTPSAWIEAPEIVKSIVYGGLNESIASVSVVASAAGAGSSTLSIFALALANLIGGLIVFLQCLIQLRNDQPREESTQQSDLQDRYQELLGRRHHFFIHATLAIISYLVFGSLFPIVYAFSFRGTNDKDYKLAIVAAVALFCIILLAVGKANAHKKSYLKTLSIYLITGISAPGVAFLVGDLIGRLLQKVGWFNLNSAAAMNFPGTRVPMDMGWASYY